VLPGVLGGARRAEDADGGRQLGQGAEALDDLRLHAQHAPGVGVDPAAGGALFQQPLVGCARLHLGPPAEHRTETRLLGRLLRALPPASDHARSLRVPGCSTPALIYARYVQLTSACPPRTGVYHTGGIGDHAVSQERSRSSPARILAVSTRSSRRCAKWGLPGP